MNWRLLTTTWIFLVQIGALGFLTDHQWLDEIARIKDGPPREQKSHVELLPDLGNVTVLVAYENYAPHLMVHGNGTPFGLYGDILATLKVLLNVSFEMVKSVDGKWGGKVTLKNICSKV